MGNRRTYQCVVASHSTGVTAAQTEPHPDVPGKSRATEPVASHDIRIVGNPDDDGTYVLHLELVLIDTDGNCPSDLVDSWCRVGGTILVTIEE